MLLMQCYPWAVGRAAMQIGTCLANMGAVAKHQAKVGLHWLREPLMRPQREQTDPQKLRKAAVSYPTHLCTKGITPWQPGESGLLLPVTSQISACSYADTCRQYTKRESS